MKTTEAIRQVRISFQFDFLDYGGKLLLSDAIQNQLLSAMATDDPFVLIREPSANDSCTWYGAKSFHHTDPINNYDPLAQRMYEVLVDHQYSVADKPFVIRGHYGIVIDYQITQTRLLWTNKAFILLDGVNGLTVSDTPDPWQNIKSVVLK